MLKRQTGIFLAVFLMIQMVLPVSARTGEDTAIEVVSGYCLQDELHAFLKAKEGYPLETFEANLQTGVVAADSSGTITLLEDSDSIIRYVLLIDLSGSMRKYSSWVEAFVDSIAENESQKAFYTVATFGERFEIVSENLTDKNAVEHVLSELSYKENYTDPYTGVEGALTYLDGTSRRNGDLINLIVVTDGEPAIKDADKETISKLAQEAQKAIEGTPEIIVSTLCTGEWDRDAYEAFVVGTGIHETVENKEGAEEAGKSIAEYADGLYRVSFKLSKLSDAERFLAQMRIMGQNKEGQTALFNIDLENVPNLKLFSNSTDIKDGTDTTSGGDISPNSSAGEQGDAEKATAPEEQSKTENGEKSESEVTEQSGIEETSPVDQEDEEQSKTEKLAGKEQEEADSGDARRAMLIAGGFAGVLVAMVTVIFLFMRAKNKGDKKTGKKRQNTAAQNPPAGAIAMKLEVYEGKCKNKQPMLYLSDSLIIGSEKHCDLIFDEPDMDAENSRVFISNQMVYIEDMDSRKGTYLGGMRIQGANRLRSGDVISIGKVEFSLKF